MSALGFCSRHLGNYVTAPGGAGNQCVDLVNLYLLEEYKAPHVFRNARDWAGYPLHGWTWVANGPANHPHAGDIVVWGPYAPLGIGPVGHIALVLDADANHLLTMDQDWPFGAPCRLELHTYGGVLGWQTLAPHPSHP